MLRRDRLSGFIIAIGWNTRITQLLHWGWEAPSTIPPQWIWPWRQPFKEGVPAVPRRLCGDSNKKVQLDTQPLDSRHGSGGVSSMGRLREAVLLLLAQQY